MGYKEMWPKISVLMCVLLVYILSFLFASSEFLPKSMVKFSGPWTCSIGGMRPYGPLNKKQQLSPLENVPVRKQD